MNIFWLLDLSSIQWLQLLFTGIIDNSIACLVTWLEGHSLAQTVFINLYSQQPSRIEDKNLKAFIIVFLKTTDLIKEYINQWVFWQKYTLLITNAVYWEIRASVFEEEDFQPLVYGFRLASEVPEQKALAAIKESEEDILKEIKNKTPVNADESQELMVTLVFNLHWKLSDSFTF